MNYVEELKWRGLLHDMMPGTEEELQKGMATGYAIDRLQDRGRFYIDPGDQVYKGQVIGEHIRPGDLVINVTRAIQLTNFRAAGSDDNVRITPKINFSLEEAMEYIEWDEYVELTPKSIRVRKIYLDENERKRQQKKVMA